MGLVWWLDWEFMKLNYIGYESAQNGSRICPVWNKMLNSCVILDCLRARCVFVRHVITFIVLWNWIIKAIKYWYDAHSAFLWIKVHFWKEFQSLALVLILLPWFWVVAGYWASPSLPWELTTRSPPPPPSAVDGSAAGPEMTDSVRAFLRNVATVSTHTNCTQT